MCRWPRSSCPWPSSRCPGGSGNDSIGTARIARWTLPIWLYVSVTGVLVYVLLYQPTWLI